eukprot:evm.model.scf_2111.2 EVM.evm.TU.scf_2111.2   scf_2111:19511-21232(-)
MLKYTIVPKEDTRRRTAEVVGVQFSSGACSLSGPGECLVSEAIYELKWYSQLSTVINIAQALFIVLVLGVRALLFSRDANNLVLLPVERMIHKVQRRCRQIDCVATNGSNKHIGPFTCDVSTELIPAAALTPEGSWDDHEYVNHSESQFGCEWEERPNHVNSGAMTEDFLERFSEGFSEYLSGRWDRAGDILGNCKTLRRSPGSLVVVGGPSATLLEFMAGMGNSWPPD